MEFTPEWFDSSSRAWLANKKRKGQTYIYVCGVETCKRGVGRSALNCSLHSGGIILSSELPKKQEIVKQEACSQYPRTGESPTEPKDLGVAGRVAHRRRGCQSQ